jgi:hypothetical protein
MATPAFGKALDDRNNYQQDGHVPIVHGVNVSAPQGMPKGKPLFAGMELWVPPKPNVYQDGLPVYEVCLRASEFCKMTGDFDSVHIPFLTCITLSY